mgnify:CR=1 FL=1
MSSRSAKKLSRKAEELSMALLKEHLSEQEAAKVNKSSVSKTEYVPSDKGTYALTMSTKGMKLMQRKRKQRPPELRRSKGGYDSGFERVLHQTVLKEWEHHSDNIEYVIKHKYEPDFIRKFADKTIQ